MPHVDKRSGELVIRIVYDGAPEAGKTTNIQQLTSMIALQRRGAAESPGTRGRRTEFFDWLDFSGGFIDGRRVRCQLVSVPGQPHLLHRRRYLLEAADAVVFVADSRRDRVKEGCKNLAMMRRVLESLEPRVSVGIVVQANKQDLHDALAAAELARAFELAPTVAVMASAAAVGDGVMQTFILATRLATDRVRAMLYDNMFSDLAMLHETPAALLEAMTSLDGGASAISADSEPGGSSATGDPESSTTQVRRINRCAPERRPALGPDLEISAGHVWPPVKGRALLSNAGLAMLEVPEFVVPWAPPDAIELAAEAWVFHTAERWLFDSEARARHELLTLVKRQLAWGEFLPEGRASFLASEGECWRLWVLTARTETLREAMTSALKARDPDRLRRLLFLVREFSRGLASERPPSGVPIDIDSLSTVANRMVALVINEDRAPSVEAPADLSRQLGDVAAAYAAADKSASAWLESMGGLPREDPLSRGVAGSRGRS